MIRNYLKVALRNLLRHRFFSIINIVGLAISMSVCLGIIMLVADQLTYDRFNKNRSRIYRVTTQYLNDDGTPAGTVASTSPLPLAEEITTNYAGVEKAVRIRRGFGNPWMELETHDINIPLAGFYADKDALSLFQYELKYGDPSTALRDPYCVVLTSAAAKKLFREDNPLGQTVTVGKLGTYKVTGVMVDDLPKSHIVFEALASYSSVPSLEADSTLRKGDGTWDDWTSGWVYFMTNEGVSRDDIEVNLAKIATAHKPTDKAHSPYQFNIQGLTEITPGPFINNPIGPFMPMIFVYFFGGLALLVMLTSCFNYTNLSIARSLTRAREIGVRKVNGAQRYQIFCQFLAEAVILSFFSLSLALLLLQAVKPFMLHLSFAKALHWDLEGNMYVYAAFILFTVVVGILAGMFPAVLMSKFQPITVLKNLGGVKLFSRLSVRKSLLVIQFTLSLIFIISVIVLYNQLTLFVSADHGFSMDKVINIRLNTSPVKTLQTELLSHSNITNVTASSHTPAIGTSYGNDFKRNLSDEEQVMLNYFSVDEQYMETLNISMVAGKGFDPIIGEGNKGNIVINQRALKSFHFESPLDAIGQVIYLNNDSSAYKIVGVVKDYNHEVLMSKIEALALRYVPDQFHQLSVKYTGSHEEAMTTIKSAWAKVNPSLKLDCIDMEEEVHSFYKTVFSDFVNIIGVISVMAIVIACLGLLGMATYTLETRLKELSIRKVLGADGASLVMLLSRGFVMLLFLAVIIALPIAWFINNLWLELIAYHTTVSAGVIVSAVGILVVLGGVTIGSQTLRAAYANPVDHLKNG